MSATVLYTPEVLGLATALAHYPFDRTAPLIGEARSRSCGSAISLSLGTDEEGRIARVGVRSQACAIGQAAAAIFAAAAVGLTPVEIQTARDAVRAWLNDSAGLPDWPGIGALASARDYPARHGAILLAWNAASDLLSSD